MDDVAKSRKRLQPAEQKVKLNYELVYMHLYFTVRCIKRLLYTPKFIFAGRNQAAETVNSSHRNVCFHKHCTSMASS
jgi:hypothetical protein